jgi:hypothetical protein
MTERRVLCRIGWVLVGLLALVSIRAFVHMVQVRSIVDQYIGPLYFVDYSDGFIRRGLVGEVVDLVAGHGQTSTEVAGWTLTLLGTLAAIAIVLQAARRCSDRSSRCLVATLGLLTPLGVATVLRDPGRYDAIGLVFIALLLWVTRRRLNPVVVACGVAVALAVVVASEEFLIAYLAPPVAVLLYREAAGAAGGVRDPRLRRRLFLLGGVAFVPALGIALASYASTPSESYLHEVQNESHAQAHLNPTYFLGLSFRENVHYVASHGVRYVIGTGVVWFAIYAVSLVAIWLAAGRYGRWYWLSAAYFGLVAVGLSVVALDARRWWTLALLSHLAVVAAGPAPEEAPAPSGSSLLLARRIVVPLAFVVFLYGQSLLVIVSEPTDFAGSGYWHQLLDYWYHGHALE